MTREERVSRKITLHLSRLFRDEVVELAKLRRMRTQCYEIGGLLMVLSLYASGRSWWAEWLNSLFGSTGGVLVGLGVLYDSAINQWPALKQFIDGEKLAQTVLRYEP